MRPNEQRHRRRRRPFWIPASTYYFLASAVAIGVFFLVWAILHDSQEESPWIPAGLVASGILICSGALRELILRGARKRAVIEQQRLDLAILSGPMPRVAADPDKLTLERNTAFLNEIQRKSEAARVLASIPASHREVFELCEEYLGLVDRELPRVNIGSPRLRPLTKGREYAARFHRYHMLRWAEGVAKSFAQVAATEFDPARKLENATEVLAALGMASLHYPDESKLKDSESAVKELILSTKAKVLIDRVAGARAEAEDEELQSLLGEAEILVSLGEEQFGAANSIFLALRSEIDNLKGRFSGL